MKITGEKVFDIFLLAVAAVFVLMARDFTPRARLLPLFIGIPAAVLMLAQVTLDFGTGKPAAKPLTPEQRRRQYLMGGSLLGLFALIFIVGLCLGLGLYLTLFIRFIGRRSWWLALSVGFVAFAVTYGLFGVVLHYPLYSGYVGRF